MSWDDGKHAKVKKVQLTFDDVIRSIEVEYEGTNLKSQRRGTVGTKSDGFTLSSDEYITNVSGYYKTIFVGDVITALTFKTNKKTYGPYGNKTQNYFSADAPRDSQIAGFLGTSGDALSSLDVHFAPIPTPGSIKPQPGGGGGGSGTDTGGGSKPGSGTDTGGGSKPGSGTGGSIPGSGTDTGGGLIPGSGTDTGGGSKPGSGTDTGGGPKPGSGTDTGGGSKPGSGTDTGGGSKPGSGTGSEQDSSKTNEPGKMGPLGGEKGNVFDDVGFEGVKKITVAADEYSVTYIKIEYIKDGKVVVREHGTIRGELKEFSVDYPKENIVAVGGTYKHIFTYDTTLITSLYFTTAKGITSPLFGEGKGTEFEFKDENGGKLIGFHGRGGNAIDAIGAYFDTGSNSGSSAQKIDAQGGKGGNQWDDGGDHDGVTKVHVAVGRVIEQIRFDYVKNGQIKEGSGHGVKGGRSTINTFEISHPDEYLLSVKGWSDSSNKIVGIQFITNKKTSDYYGYDKYPGEEGTDISLEVKDKKIVGFHGFADTHPNSLGAYFAPIASTPLKPSKKLKAVGGDEGASWDDGAFDGVKKIQVGQNNDGVSFVAVEYVNGSQKVLGDGHGKKSALGVETFELTDPGEYITSVGVYYDKIHAAGRGVTLVTSLKFKTNKQESQPFGMTSGEYVELKEEGKKIVGFHGKASDWVHQIGVYVAPITN